MICLGLFTACSSDDDDEQKEITETPKTEANSQFDQSNYGIYKGVFIGSSGVIAINLGNEGNSPFAILIIDGVTYNFTTSQTVKQGENTSILFKQGQSNSFVFSVKADGSDPEIIDITIVGHPNAQMVVVKETSSVEVECYEGTYTGDYSSGTFNLVINGNHLTALAYSSNYNYVYPCSGTINTNDSISGIVVYDNITFEGKKNSDETISGTWTHPAEEGIWKGTLKSITTFKN